MKKLFFTPPVLLSLLATLLLILVQFYLVRQVYQLKNTQFTLGYNDGINYVAPALRFSWKLADSVVHYYQQQLAKEPSLKTDSHFKAEVFQAFRQALKSNRQLEQSLRENFQRNKIDTNFKYALMMNRFAFKKNDTIVTVLLNVPKHSPRQVKILGNLQNLQNASLVHVQFYTGYSFIINLQVYIAFPYRQNFLFREMTSLFLLISITLLITAGVFVYTIRNLLKHKKLSTLQNDFINNITHEITTPLATLTITGQTLQKPLVQQSPKKVEELAQLLTRQTLRLQRLFDRVLDVSVWDNDTHKISPEPVHLNTFTQEVVHEFTLSLASKSSRFCLTFSPDCNCLPVFLDKLHFTTVLYNLLDNAFKYSSSSIVVKTHCTTTHALLQIQDKGVGISSEAQKYIFNKFYREPSGNVHNVKGLGLGLYYVKKIVQAHQGEIQVKSDLGKGSIFEISLPLASSPLLPQ